MRRVLAKALPRAQPWGASLVPANDSTSHLAPGGALSPAIPPQTGSVLGRSREKLLGKPSQFSEAIAIPGRCRVRGDLESFRYLTERQAAPNLQRHYFPVNVSHPAHCFLQQQISFPVLRSGIEPEFRSIL